LSSGCEPSEHNVGDGVGVGVGQLPLSSGCEPSEHNVGDGVGWGCGVVSRKHTDSIGSLWYPGGQPCGPDSTDSGPEDGVWIGLSRDWGEACSDVWGRIIVVGPQLPLSSGCEPSEHVGDWANPLFVNDIDESKIMPTINDKIYESACWRNLIFVLRFPVI